MGGEKGRDETEGEGRMKGGQPTIGFSVVEDSHCSFSLPCCILARFILGPTISLQASDKYCDTFHRA